MTGMKPSDAIKLNHVPLVNRENYPPEATLPFKTFLDKVMRMYKRVNTGNEKETRINLSEDQTLKPYQLRGNETSIKQPPSNQKQINRMKKKLGKLNKKIRHSKRKHNNLISKRNSIKKKIEEQKELQESREPEEYFNPIEREQAFGRAYRSYRINGRSRMDVDTFFDWIRQDLIDLMTRELGSARVQMTTWIRFRQALEDDFGNVIGFDRVEFPSIVG